MRATCYASRHALVLVILLLSGMPGPRTVAQTSASSRVVVIGDIHGDFDSFRGILTQSGLIDASGGWAGGNATLVQTGDFTDRGPKVRAVMDLLIDLEKQAPAAGGRVAVLIGNHETMNMMGEGRDVTPDIYATFADEQSEQRREAAYEAYVKLCAARATEIRRSVPKIYQALSKGDWMATHPPGFVEYRDAFSPQGRYGRWLRGKPAVLHLGDTAFLHAGINPNRAPRSLEDINKQVTAEVKRFDEYRSRMVDRKLVLPFFTLSEVLAAAQIEVEASGSAPDGRSGDSGGTGGLDQLGTPDPLRLRELLRIDSWTLVDPNGPLWFRGFATWSAEVGAIQIRSVLQRYNVAHFVVGHTVPTTRRITPRFSGAVFLIDTGMVFPGGVPSALEIRDGRFTAIYLNERVTVLEPGERAAPVRR